MHDSLYISSVSPEYIRYQTLVITVSADMLAPSSARPSAGAVMTTKTAIISSAYLWQSWYTITFHLLYGIIQIAYGILRFEKTGTSNGNLARYISEINPIRVISFLWVAVLAVSPQRVSCNMHAVFLRLCSLYPSKLLHGALTRYVKLQVAHAPGMPGTFSAPPTSRKIACSSFPACSTARASRRGGENVSGIPSACVSRKFTYLVRGPLAEDFYNCVFVLFCFHIYIPYEYIHMLSVSLYIYLIFIKLFTSDRILVQTSIHVFPCSIAGVVTPSPLSNLHKTQ